ncbi:hypothetical protein C8R46DRAFT_1025929 [Mycena filopes]|nr:hypothetical protein C8R46DRAFT_1025929 [Mycena filopes]
MAGVKHPRFEAREFSAFFIIIISLGGAAMLEHKQICTSDVVHGLLDMTRVKHPRFEAREYLSSLNVDYFAGCSDVGNQADTSDVALRAQIWITWAKELKFKPGFDSRRPNEAPTPITLFVPFHWFKFDST